MLGPVWDSGSQLSNGTRINCYRVGGCTLTHLQAKAIAGAPAGSAGKALHRFLLSAACIQKMVEARGSCVLPCRRHAC